MRLDIGDGDSLPLDTDSVQVGDWVKSKSCGVVVGKVERIGYLGKHKIPVFIVRLANGKTEVITKDDIRILGLGA